MHQFLRRPEKGRLLKWPAEQMIQHKLLKFWRQPEQPTDHVLRWVESSGGINIVENILYNKFL